MVKSCIILFVFLLGASCAHRHHDHVDHLTSSFLQDTSLVLSDNSSNVVTAVDTNTQSPDDTVEKVDVIDTSTAIITAFTSSFNAGDFDEISLGPISDSSTLPTSEIATYSGHTLLGDSIDGEVALSIDFATHDASGQISNMTYFGDAGVAPLTGQLDMVGQTVSRIGLKLAVDGSISSELTGSTTVTGTLRGLFYGTGADGFAGYLTSTSTLPVLEGQTMSGTVYAD